MRIGRILINDTEYYGIIKDQTFYSQDITRDRNGTEAFLNSELDPDWSDPIDLSTTDFIWLPPIANPSKILCIGRNYAEHSREQGKDPESNPLIFSKFPTSLTGHLSSVPYPNHTEYLDYEVELAVIIGQTASELEESDDPWSYIFGYTIANDLTARDVQKSEKQWTRGKGFDNSLPIGPVIVTSDSVDYPNNNEIWLTVNGDRRQYSNTANMIFTIPYLIRYISQTITLEPGDIILTGTPEGVGYYMEPRQTLKVGDEVACGVTNIAELRFDIT